ncbi:MAG: nucleotidyltransferase domain-containing protein [Candidatus Limnocylindrales bacterium]
MPAPLLSRAVDSVLQVVALNPDRPFFQRELARLTGEPYNGVVQALRRLVRDGLVATGVIGGKPAFYANGESPYFDEFQRIALKSLGIPGALDSGGVVAIKAAVFGSFAKGVAGPQSDLDVFVVGSEPSPGAASAALAEVSRKLGRSVNVVVYDHARYLQAGEDPGSFVSAVANGPVVNLRGTL